MKQKNKSKHTMPFCSSALRAKNVGITVTCTECGKPQLLFSAKRISDKNHQTLYQFLDTILYTCGTSFKNTNELTLANRYLDNNDNAILPEIVESPIESDNEDGNDDVEKSPNFEYDIAISDEEDNQSDHDTVEPRNFDSSEDAISDLIQKLFTHIFVNDSWTCASPIEKLYYLAKIYPNICCNCGTTILMLKSRKNIYLTCNNCNTNSKRYYK